jgi:hypothetical protein
MAKVKKCLDTGCTEFILLDDGRAIQQPKESCDIKHVPKDFQEQFNEIAKEAKETIYVSKTMFKHVKEGKEIEL